MHPSLRLRLPHLPLPAVLLSLVYLAAIAVAVSDSAGHTLAGLVVLTGLAARWLAHARRREPAATPVALAVAGTATTVDAVLDPEPAPAAAAA
ncbi:hypothetical protein [Blastococcus xanthinilyticus]|uniref:Uncharacterized protein n=1 Tax=Blastococcus xanthinilyticus TaxID=1564164 RepID=A0A5S5CN61_9ACTN|nr:hypothetical protein [Blastococcus xanthinilyticus]TYP83831.1 hypothetical protein BD833_11571 [Blastococcus xanthinilyticus]